MPQPEKLILASASPRRRELMQEAGLRFDVITAETTECEDADLGIERLVAHNARLKCVAVAKDHPDAVVIGADTLVALDGQPLGKPRDLEHGVEMLRLLSGKTHVVCTGVCLIRHHPAKEVEFIETTWVTFRDLSDAEIRAYLSLINPLDKAGSYAAQEHGERILAGTKGSWSNIVGLPMEALMAQLTEWAALDGD